MADVAKGILGGFIGFMICLIYVIYTDTVLLDTPIRFVSEALGHVVLAGILYLIFDGMVNGYMAYKDKEISGIRFAAVFAVGTLLITLLIRWLT